MYNTIKQSVCAQLISRVLPLVHLTTRWSQVSVKPTCWYYSLVCEQQPLRVDLTKQQF